MNWPDWDFSERNEASINRFIQFYEEKAVVGGSQDYGWLLNLVPSWENQSVNEFINEGEESEWESEDESVEQFPSVTDILSSLQNVPKSVDDQNVHMNAVQRGIKTNQGTHISSSLDCPSVIHENNVLFNHVMDQEKGSEELQGCDIKSILSTLQDEKLDKKKKLELLSVTRDVADADVISLVQEAYKALKSAEEKSTFCSLLTETLRERSFLLAQNFFLPWFQDSKSDIGVSMSTLCKSIEFFSETACREIILPLLKIPDSCLNCDLHLLKDIMNFVEPNYWIFLLKEFVVFLTSTKLVSWHLCVLDLLSKQAVEACITTFDEYLMNGLVTLLLANAMNFSEDRNFGNIILVLIKVLINNEKDPKFLCFVSQIQSIIKFYKGPIKFKANQMLKKITA